MERADRFLAACHRQPVDCTPVWFMRQAGRYMPEYRAIRTRHTLLDICAQPELAAEVTLQPINAFDVDAAIIFADILLPLVPMGMNLEFAAGEGPVLHNPLRSRADIDALRDIDPVADLKSTLDALSIVRREIDGKVALIGFAGGPFTLASYAIEGGSSRNYQITKSLMYRDPDTWFTLMEKITRMTSAYLLAQVAAGAQCVQIFDSWAGALSPDDYRRFVLPATKSIVDSVRSAGAPIILFGTNTAGMLDAIASAGSDVVGADWRIGLDDAWRQIGHDQAIQGNLDPLLLFAPADELRSQVAAVLDRAGGRPGHIFNVGHGILPETPTESVHAVVEMVHEMTAHE
ncbi:MAG TPA: uroporphyrinogen decarboxylase [Thermomicrobiales bacterium]|nr:uroporphyrinogen decarboxylase [Chloroflexota bacterium]HQZ88483.1 uroporphyrinogen decarboxylase [Thermomicrobiales bacterium]HRA30387.1 uroporphyrinogen decarboxylase [Thermomicrobiales bacterium]